MKRIAALLLAGLLLFAACRKQPPEADAGHDESAESTELAGDEHNEPEEDEHESENEESPFYLIGAYQNDSGLWLLPEEPEWEYQFNITDARKYFYGEWEYDSYLKRNDSKTERFDDTKESDIFLAWENAAFNYLYKAGNTVIYYSVFDFEAHYYWIHLGEPDVMYFAVYSYNWDEYDDSYAFFGRPYRSVRTAPANEPADGYLSAFSRIDLANRTGIDYWALSQIDYEDMSRSLYNWSPIYLVSETENEVVIKTTASIWGGDIDREADLIITFEKTDGKWVKTIKEA